MGRARPDPEEDAWTVRFITDRRTRKASDIRWTSKVSVIFHHEASDAFVMLIGRTTLREGVAEVRQRWKAANDVYFPNESDRANAAFVEVYGERLELWIRGVTSEPFGLQPTILERDARGAWRIGVIR
jgi:general stress protein 26